MLMRIYACMGLTLIRDWPFLATGRSLEPRARIHGALEPWIPGSLEPWIPGSLDFWGPGPLDPYPRIPEVLEPGALSVKAVPLEWYTLVNVKDVQPFAFQLMLHILVQGWVPCLEEMAFLPDLRCQLLLLLLVLKLQCIDLVRCSVQDLILRTK